VFGDGGTKVAIEAFGTGFGGGTASDTEAMPPRLAIVGANVEAVDVVDSEPARKCCADAIVVAITLSRGVESGVESGVERGVESGEVRAASNPDVAVRGDNDVLVRAGKKKGARDNVGRACADGDADVTGHKGMERVLGRRSGLCGSVSPTDAVWLGLVVVVVVA
jgi:hypothetical protein